MEKEDSKLERSVVRDSVGVVFAKCLFCYGKLTSLPSWVFSFSIRDSWQVCLAYETCLEFQSILTASGDKTVLKTTKFLRSSFTSSVGIPNQTYWRGLSGSDDLAWAAILNIKCYHAFQDDNFLTGYRVSNGFWGAEHLYQKIVNEYMNEDGSVWWDSGCTYIAAISCSLFITLSMMLHEVNPKDEYLGRAQMTCDWLLNRSRLWNRHTGRMDDGVTWDGKVTSIAWTYNHAVILKGLTLLYRATDDLSHLENACLIIERVISDSADGICRESRKKLSRDASCFKGIFFRYLASFIHDNSELLEDSKLSDYRTFVLKNSHIVWNNCLDGDSAIFTHSWHIPTSECPANPDRKTQSLLSAFALFNAEGLLSI